VYAYPIRGVAYDPVNMHLFTGDENGYMRQLDISSLCRKVNKKNGVAVPDRTNGDATFMTGADVDYDKDFCLDDVREMQMWKAH
jgi:hypothetical protein